MRYFIVLLGSLLQFSAPSHATEKTYQELVTEAESALVNSVTLGTETEDQYQQLEKLLKNPPVARPFAQHEESGNVLYYLYYLLQRDPKRFDRVCDLVRIAIKLGANPTTTLAFEDGSSPYTDKKGKPIHVAPADVFVFEWEEVSRHPPDELSIAVIRSARQMFDILFATKALDPDYQPLAMFDDGKDGKLERMGVIPRLVLTNASPDIKAYFYNHVFEGIGWSVAMKAAFTGDLETIKQIRLECGRSEAAQMFNYNCPINYNPTVLHVAIGTVLSQGSAARAIAIINYLVENGADPSRRSMYHDLVGEVDYWSPKIPNPELKKQFDILRAYLIANKKKLEMKYSNFCSGILNPDGE